MYTSVKIHFFGKEKFNSYYDGDIHPYCAKKNWWPAPTE
jgi:hypothetical protein